MNKYLLIVIVLTIFSSAYLFCQESSEIDELYPVRKELADFLFPENQNEWATLKEAFLNVKRELYIDENYRSAAYKNMPLPVKGGLIQPSPQFIADILKESSIATTSKVLLIGRNTGYFARLLSELTGNLFVSDSTSVNPSDNRYRLLNNLSYYGWLEEAPYDCIVLFGSVHEIPRGLISQLENGGKLIAPISFESGSQVLISATKYSNGFYLKTIGDSYIHPLH